ncbi:MAG TPA: hypothetical protein VG308_05540 [Stellaceae bacterium]|nr:hypothetical protein [Stellaceae bacterium]
MKAVNKMLLGAVALVTVTAASYPRGISDMYLNGTHPQDLRKQEALKLCQQESLSFVSFLASDRDQCYRQMRGLGMTASFSGVWSKPDRKHMQVAALD